MDPSYRQTRRRSVPRLPEFSITPLRTHLENSLADEQGSHSYSQPQTPRSPRSTFHSPSHTPTVLSRASSREPDRSGGRRRKVKSALLLADLERPLAQAAAATEDGLSMPVRSKSSLKLHRTQTDFAAQPAKGHIPKSKSISGHHGSRGPSNAGQGSDWLLSTASVLAMTAAESKGQSWLATKSASTSLAGTPFIEKDEFNFRPLTKAQEIDDLLNSPANSRPGSRRNSLPTAGGGQPKSRRGSRGNSKMGSRVGSRANLASLRGRTPGEIDRRSDYFSNMGVDFADEDDELDGESDDDLDEFEENELKKLVWGRVGGWVDWAVGWMDWRDGLEGVSDDEDEKDAKPQDDGQAKKRRRAAIKNDVVSQPSETTVPAPPQQAGLAGDAKWLFGVVGKLIV